MAAVGMQVSGSITLNEVFAQVAKNGRSEVRVAVREYKGRRALDIREFYRDDSNPNGTMRPGKGAWLPQGVAEEVMDALTEHRDDVFTLLEAGD